tara:strand:+ start:12127 stop:12375 length:249 start_codon:yes stop_codon:yes gene_type:complete
MNKITINDTPQSTGNLERGQFWLDQTNETELFVMHREWTASALVLVSLIDGKPYAPPSDDDPFGGDRDDFRQIFSFSVEAGE